MPGLPDVVRPNQLPSNSPGQLYLSQYGLAANTPIYVTPGFGGQSGGQLPPILTGAGHFNETVTVYTGQASVEQGRGA
jgi:hypothetical protein